MMNLAELLQNFSIEEAKPEKGTPRTAKEERVVNFLEELNKDRTREVNIERYKVWLKENRLRHSQENGIKFSKTKYFLKPLEYRAVVFKLTKYSRDVFDWDILYRQCKDSGNFGKTFWWKLKN